MNLITIIQKIVFVVVLLLFLVSVAKVQTIF